MNKKINIITLYLLLHILNVHSEPLTFFRPKSNVPTVRSKKHLTALQNTPKKKTLLAIEDKGLFSHSDTRTIFLNKLFFRDKDKVLFKGSDTGTIFLSKLFFGNKALKSIDLQSVKQKNDPMHNVRFFTYSKIRPACSNSETVSVKGIPPIDAKYLYKNPHPLLKSLQKLQSYPLLLTDGSAKSDEQNTLSEKNIRFFMYSQIRPICSNSETAYVKGIPPIDAKYLYKNTHPLLKALEKPQSYPLLLTDGSAKSFAPTSSTITMTKPEQKMALTAHLEPEIFAAVNAYNNSKEIAPLTFTHQEGQANQLCSFHTVETFATPNKPDTAMPLISKIGSHVGSWPNKKIFALQNAARQNFAASNKYNQNKHTYLATSSKNQFHHGAQTTSINTSSYFSAPDKPDVAEKILPLDVHQKKFQAHSKTGSADQIQEQFAASINYTQPCPLQQDTVANSGQIQQRAMVVVENSDHEHFTAPNAQKTTQIDIGKNALSQSFFTPEEQLSCLSYKNNYTVENFAASDNCLQAGYNRLTKSMLQNHTADSEKIELPIIITLSKCKPDGLTELRRRMLSGKQKL